MQLRVGCWTGPGIHENEVRYPHIYAHMSKNNQYVSLYHFERPDA